MLRRLPWRFAPWLALAGLAWWFWGLVLPVQPAWRIPTVGFHDLHAGSSSAYVDLVVDGPDPGTVLLRRLAWPDGRELLRRVLPKNEPDANVLGSAHSWRFDDERWFVWPRRQAYDLIELATGERRTFTLTKPSNTSYPAGGMVLSPWVDGPVRLVGAGVDVVSPPGAMLIGRSANESHLLWGELASRRVLVQRRGAATMSEIAKDWSSPWHAKFSPDGEWLAYGTAPLRIHATADGRQAASLDGGHPFGFSVDGRHVFVSTWEPKAGDRIARYELATGRLAGERIVSADDSVWQGGAGDWTLERSRWALPGWLVQPLEQWLPEWAALLKAERLWWRSFDGRVVRIGTGYRYGQVSPDGRWGAAFDVDAKGQTCALRGYDLAAARPDPWLRTGLTLALLAIAYLPFFLWRCWRLVIRRLGDRQPTGSARGGADR